MIYIALLLAWLLMPRKKRKRSRKKTIVRKTVYYRSKPAARSRDKPKKSAYKPEPVRETRKPPGPSIDPRKQAEREYKRKQAEADKIFLISRQDAIMRQLWQADKEYQRAQQLVDYDNVYSVAISEKQAAKHMAELDKIIRRQAVLEKEIHNIEKQLARCEYIISSE